MFRKLRSLFGQGKVRVNASFEELERAYLAAYPDVALAISEGEFRSGLDHWVNEGAREGRCYAAIASGDFVRRLETQVQDLQKRITQLEALTTEHPAVASRGGLKPGAASPYVSVIMPTWNRSSIVADAISSVQSQRFTDWELIIVDDGSEDDTAETIRRFSADPRIRYRRVEHMGQSAARNIGLQLARGELVAYQDSDNLWYPDFLTAAVSAFAADDGLDVAYGAMISDVHIEDRKILFEPFDRARLLEANFIAMTTLVHRRKLVERWGGFDGKLKKLEDWDLILKFTQHKPARAIPVIASRCRVVDGKRVSDTDRDAHRHAIDLIRKRWRN